MTQPLWTMQDLAAYLGKSLSWVRGEVAARRIPFTKIGKSPRFTPEHVATILAAGESKKPPQVFIPRTVPPGTPPPDPPPPPPPPRVPPTGPPSRIGARRKAAA
jgi:hypothetical protein